MQNKDEASQSIEVLPLFLDAEDLHLLKPIHTDSLKISTSPSQEPTATVIESLARYGIVPSVVHSTSWRTDSGRMILSYLVVIDKPARLYPDLEIKRIGRVDLARGEATSAPKVIRVEQVIEHGIRHLAWLSHDDAAIAERLCPEWHDKLKLYTPEPFRSFRGAAPA